jgi:NAD(P)-dependent dehydrogenase (short-subunit alcohol dehydrogenase family)
VRKKRKKMKAIVTGGNKGIGFEITKTLQSYGCEVNVLSRTGVKSPLESVISWQIDIADFNQVQTVLNKIGKPDILINNAGIMNTMQATDNNQEQILNILNINLISAVRMSVYIAEIMANAGGGRIVSIGSLAGEIGHPDIWYGVSKAGLMNAMRSIARTYGPKGVIANSVAPGPVETEMINSIPEERKTRVKSSTINQRFCIAEEVANVVCWLATESPEYMNGEVIDINNGINHR